MIALKAGRITSVPISEVAGKIRTIPHTHPLFVTAKSLGICMGA